MKSPAKVGPGKVTSTKSSLPPSSATMFANCTREGAFVHVASGPASPVEVATSLETAPSVDESATSSDASAVPLERSPRSTNKLQHGAPSAIATAPPAHREIRDSERRERREGTLL